MIVCTEKRFNGVVFFGVNLKPEQGVITTEFMSISFGFTSGQAKIFDFNSHQFLGYVKFPPDIKTPRSEDQAICPVPDLPFIPARNNEVN